MRDIAIEVLGDVWCNRDRVPDLIRQCAGEDCIRFVVNTEGPSLWALGIVDTIQAVIKDIGLRDDQVWIDCWHNTVESIPFRRAYNPLISHFFWMSDSYRHATRLPAATVTPLGFFVGRLTLERAAMLWYVIRTWETQVMISLMQQPNQCYFDQDQVKEPWVDHDQKSSFLTWIKSCPVTSITNHSVRDQYLAGNDTNRDLVMYYDHFCVELVSETYCLGDTFFPTEKTVRPISQAKPMIVYGPKNFLSRLRNMGFLTWGDFWDESYDGLAGYDRWQAITTVVHDLLARKTYLDPGLQQINQHNVDVLDAIIRKHKPG